MAEITNLDETFDYIVVGAGAGGCVVANRLSEDPQTRVLLLEAGGRDNWIWHHIPVGYLFAIGNPRADWMFTTEAEPGLNGRALGYPRGKVLGGSTAINAMISMRGQSEDYDNWRQLGLSGWGWDDVFPVFRDMEDHYLGPNPHHGSGGPWRVERPRTRWEALDAVRDAAVEMGVPATEDYNTGDNEGVCYFQVNQQRGRRWSAARGYLRPAKDRPNLRIVTDAMVDRVLLEGARATGVRWRGPDGQLRQATARSEVVLSAGAIGSVQILQRSGIGPGDVLQAAGVDVLVEREGVGRNLQDHLQLRTIFEVSEARTLNETYHSLLGRAWIGLEYALFRRGPLTMAPSQLGIFTRSSPQEDRPNIEFHVQPLSLDKFGDPLHRYPAITVSVCNLRPTSLGQVKITSPDPDAKPSIAPNYLSTERDRDVAAESIRAARRLMAQPALARHKPTERLPGPQVGDDDAALKRAAAEIGTTIFHPVGTTKMGLESDPMAVVDERLRVFGAERLRIVDASIMPTITSGNTATPTVMIGEKGAAFLRCDAKVIC